MEAAGGPTVGYKVGTQGNRCVTEGSICTRLTEQDSVIRGLSALSLYVHSQTDPEPCVVDNTDAGVASQEKSGSSHCVSITSSIADNCFPSYFMTVSDNLQTAHPQEPIYSERKFELLHRFPLSPPNEDYLTHNSRLARFGSGPGMFLSHNQHLSALDVVSEDTPWERSPVDGDFIKSDSVSSYSSVSEECSCESHDVSQGVSGEPDTQNTFEGPLDCMSSLDFSLPARKGLSRFFSGKSRSFTSLADVVSVRDLAKPENPYSRKRKNAASYSGSLDRPRLYPLRNGAGVSKKHVHNNKSTLALAVAMSTEESIFDRDEHEHQIQIGSSSRYQSGSAPCRSFSLSDLQREAC
eukprot:c23096_g1_i1 orf=540-1595(+)